MFYKSIYFYLLLFILTYPIKYISYPCLSLYICYQYFWNKRTGFWARQPIHSDKYGLITDPQTVSIDLSLGKDENWWVFSGLTGEIEMMRAFLETNYEKDLIVTEAYLWWLINNQGYTFFGILGSDKKLIGLIGASWTTLQIGDEVHSGYYVDLLCVSREHRKSGYAVKLIERVVDSWQERGGDINLFKLDNIKIEPEPDFQFNYYLLDKTKLKAEKWKDSGSQLRIVNGENLEEAFNYFRVEMEKYPIREVYTLERFQKWVLGDVEVTRTYLAYQEGKIIGLVNMMKNKYRMRGGKVEEALDVIYLLGNKMEIMGHLLDWKYRYYLMMDMGGYGDLIEVLGMEQLYESRYYFYNYELLHKYKKEEMGVCRF